MVVSRSAAAFLLWRFLGEVVGIWPSLETWGCWAAELDNDGRDGRQLDNVLFICRPFLLWRFLVKVWAVVGQCLVQLSPIFAMAILSRSLGGSWTMSCSSVALFCCGDFKKSWAAVGLHLVQLSPIFAMAIFGGRDLAVSTKSTQHKYNESGSG